MLKIIARKKDFGDNWIKSEIDIDRSLFYRITYNLINIRIENPVFAD